MYAWLETARPWFVRGWRQICRVSAVPQPSAMTRYVRRCAGCEDCVTLAQHTLVTVRRQLVFPDAPPTNPGASLWLYPLAMAKQVWNRFLEHVFNAVVRHVDFSIVKCLVIAGQHPRAI